MIKFVSDLWQFSCFFLSNLVVSTNKTDLLYWTENWLTFLGTANLSIFFRQSPTFGIISKRQTFAFFIFFMTFPKSSTSTLDLALLMFWSYIPWCLMSLTCQKCQHLRFLFNKLISPSANYLKLMLNVRDYKKQIKVNFGL
jgi:hypothetical protein